MQRIVIKVGSTSISDKESLNLDRMRALVSLINELMRENEVILVSSAAISAGRAKLDIDRKDPLNRIPQNRFKLALLNPVCAAQIDFPMAILQPPQPLRIRKPVHFFEGHWFIVVWTHMEDFHA